MTLTTYTPARYTGTNSTAVYAFAFRILQDADLVVIQTDLGGVESTLALTTDYTVTGAGSYSGGSITLLAGDLPTGYGLTLKRVVGIDQPTSIRNQGAFFPEVHEKVFDRLTMIDQQQQEELNRSFKLAANDGSSDPTLPAAQEGYVLGWVGGVLRNLASATSQLAVDLLSSAAGKGASLITYLAPYTGAVATTQSQINQERTTIFRWFPDSAHIVDWMNKSLVYDHTTAIQAALDNCPIGTELIFPVGGGKISDGDADGSCLVVRRPLHIRGYGAMNTVLIPDSGIGNTVKPIQFYPTPGIGSLDNTSFEGIFVGDPTNGTCAGGDTILVNTPIAGQYYSKFTMRDCFIGKSDHGYSFRQVSSGSYTDSGFACGLIENNSFRSGAAFENCGDSVVLRGNILTGDRLGLYLFNLTGSSCFSCTENNITAAGGVKIDYAPRLLWKNNNVECTGAGSNGAVVDFNNAYGPSYGGTFEGGLISCFGLTTCTQLVRLQGIQGVGINDVTFTSGGTIVTGSVAGTVLTVTAATPGDVLAGATIFAPGNTVDHPVIQPYGTAGTTGTGGTGTYSLSASATIGSASLSLIVCTTGVKIVNTGVQHTKIGANLYGQGILTKVSDSGLGTMGVVKPLTLAGTWVNYNASYAPPTFYKDLNGVVHLDGMVKDGTVNTTIASLPTGFSPTKISQFAVRSTGGAVAGLGGIEVYSQALGAGAIAQVAGGTTLVSLANISFVAENLGDSVANG